MYIVNIHAYTDCGVWEVHVWSEGGHVVHASEHVIPTIVCALLLHTPLGVLWQSVALPAKQYVQYLIAAVRCDSRIQMIEDMYSYICITQMFTDVSQLLLCGMCGTLARKSTNIYLYIVRDEFVKVFPLEVALRLDVCEY